MSTRGQAWARSGLAFLTGMPGGPADFSRAAVLAEAQRVADDVWAQLGVRIDAAELLAGRAAQLGLRRQGRTSVGGASRLLSATDGWCAITLSRADDIDAVPALVESVVTAVDPWPAVRRWVRTQTVSGVVERATLLDIPAAALGETSSDAPQFARSTPATAPRPLSDLLVADLSSMWAGPLAGRLLAQAGATVVKVESPSRPDGTRAGHQDFFDWVNGRKLGLSVDFDTDIELLRALLSVSDIVIEGSRPTALARRGCGPDDVAARAGRVWVRITGHGTDAHRVAFGDDAAVAGGLVGHSASGPVFCGDAIADPLTGLAAISAVAQSLRRGGGELIEISMAATAASYAGLPISTGTADAVRRPSLPRTGEAGPGLGAHNAEVRRLVAARARTAC